MYWYNKDTSYLNGRGKEERGGKVRLLTLKKNIGSFYLYIQHLLTLLLKIDKENHLNLV